MPADRDVDPVAAVVALVGQRDPRRGRLRVVAVDGPSASGKTTLAGVLAMRLEAPVLHLDDLVPGWGGLLASVQIVADRVLEPLSQGERAAYHRWDWTHERWGEEVLVPATGLLVLDGVGSASGPAARYAAVVVWVDAPEPVRLRRGLARDGDTYAPHWRRWADQEDALFVADHTRARADVVVLTAPARG